MIKLNILSILLMVSVVACNAQYTTDNRTLDIPKGKAITIDGEMQKAEWSDAANRDIKVGNTNIKAYIKYDEQNLYIGFTGFNENYNRWPEMLVDLGNNRSQKMDSDDWWFHISFQDCVKQGDFNTWDICTPESDIFEANNARNDEYVDFEAKIPFSNLNISPEAGKTIGLAFNVTDTQKEWNFWPEHAQIALPQSWGEATFK